MMEIQDSKSPETIEFTQTLERLTSLIKSVLSKRPPLFNGERYLTNKDMDKSLYIKERTLQIYRNEKILPYIKISGKILYKESDVLRLLERHYVNYHKNG